MTRAKACDKGQSFFLHLDGHGLLTSHVVRLSSHVVLVIAVPHTPSLIRRPRPRLSMHFATEVAHVREAQHLRWQVYGEELGALPNPDHPDLDIEPHDDFCQHILIRDADGMPVATYRMLLGKNSLAAGGFCLERLFDLRRILPLRDQILEIDRGCVHKAYRGGSTFGLLYSALVQFISANPVSYLLGAASMSMEDGGRMAASLYRQYQAQHLAPPEWQADPLVSLPLENVDVDVPGDTQSMLRGYLRMGGRLCGPPAWDQQYNSADLLLFGSTALIPVPRSPLEKPAP